MTKENSTPHGETPPPTLLPTANLESAAHLRERIKTVNADLGRIAGEFGIDETRMVMLGDTEQFISMRGHDKRAPVLLFLHGGPGDPLSGIAYAYQRPWEDFFVVVNWDQRGFGRSYGSKEDADRILGTLNKDQLIADTTELIEYLRTELDQPKIVLVGQSWGTVLALEVAKRRPDLLHVAVTQGLSARWLDSAELLRQDYIEKAKHEGNDEEAARLQELGPPPLDEGIDAVLRWPMEFGLGIPDHQTWRNIAGDGDGWQRRIETLRYISPDLPDAEFDRHAAMMEGDAMIEWRGRLMAMMGSVVDWDAERDVGTRFEVPIVVMMGSFDMQTATSLAREYYDKIHAPYKKWVEMPEAAHALNVEQPGLVVVSLVNDVLPAVHGEVPPDAETD